MAKIVSKKLKKHADVIQFMDDYKPMVHLLKLEKGFRIKGLIKIPAGMNYSVDKKIKKKATNMERAVIVKVDHDASIKEDYILSVEAIVGAREFKKVPVVGIRVFTPNVPEEGLTMVGEDDADERA